MLTAWPDLVCSFSMACLAVSGESDLEPRAFLIGANSSCRCTSSRATLSASGKVSKMKSSSFMPCMQPLWSALKAEPL